MNTLRSLLFSASMAGLALGISLAPIAGVLALPTLARADVDPGEDPSPPREPGDRATSFHAVSSGAHEDIPGGGLLVAAYGVALLALFGYVAYLGAVQAGTAREMTRLEKLVAERSAARKKD